MDQIDFIILGVCKTKKKIKKIRSMLAEPGNFVYDEVEKVYKVKSTSSTKIYNVFLSSTTGFKCDCIYNYRFKAYKEGMKRHKRYLDECIHILGLKTYLTLIKDKS